MKSIRQFLGLRQDEAAAVETSTVREIIKELDNLDPERARFVAAFAFILSRVARADLRISPEETQAMESVVMTYGKLPEGQAAIVVQMAKTQNQLFGETENYLVTREFNKIATREEKIALLHCLFAVSSSDESISTAEAHTIRQIADELRLDHSDYSAVRSRYREYLAVLKKLPDQEP